MIIIDVTCNQKLLSLMSLTLGAHTQTGSISMLCFPVSGYKHGLQRFNLSYGVTKV